MHLCLYSVSALYQSLDIIITALCTRVWTCALTVLCDLCEYCVPVFGRTCTLPVLCTCTLSVLCTYVWICTLTVLCTRVWMSILSVWVPMFVHAHYQCCVPVFGHVHCQCCASVFRHVHCQCWCLPLWLSQVPPLHVLAVCSETNLVQRLMDYAARLAARAVTHTSLHVLGANVTASPYPWAPYFLHGTPGPKPRHHSFRFMVCDLRQVVFLDTLLAS